MDNGDYVVVTNCDKLMVTGEKFEDKKYWKHSGKPGHLQLIPMEKVVADKGFKEVLRKAVNGMLPKNTFRKTRLARLKLFDGSEHPYKQNLYAIHDQQPLVQKKLKELEQLSK